MYRRNVLTNALQAGAGVVMTWGFFSRSFPAAWARLRPEEARAARATGSQDLLTEILRGTHMKAMPVNGMVHIRSHHSVQETVQRLESILRTHGLTIFCHVDHSGQAEKAGLKMRPTQLLIFGSAKAGTPLMVASPTLAIDLPLKALAWEDADGTVWLSYNGPEYLQQRHNVPDDLIKNIAGAPALLQKAAE